MIDASTTGGTRLFIRPVFYSNDSLSVFVQICSLVCDQQEENMEVLQIEVCPLIQSKEFLVTDST